MWHLVSLKHYTAEVDVTDSWEDIVIVSTAQKIIIPLGNSVGDHIWAIKIHLSG